MEGLWNVDGLWKMEVRDCGRWRGGIVEGEEEGLWKVEERVVEGGGEGLWKVEGRDCGR